MRKSLFQSSLAPIGQFGGLQGCAGHELHAPSSISRGNFMNVILPILFATVAAAGNAMFAYGQKQSSGVSNGLLYVGASALVACLLALAASPAVGPTNLDNPVHEW